MISKFEETRLQSLFKAFSGKRIAVIGDVMLDKYYWGVVSRISPEAPVPVVEVGEETSHLGGAANVAHNIKTLNATPLIFGVVGNDIAGKELRELYRRLGINEEGICVDNNRPTTVKTRVIAHNQHVVRVDHEVRSDIAHETQGMLLGALQNVITSLDGIILEDYNKGMLVPPFLGNVINLALKHNIPIMVDPKFRNFFEYRKVTVFKPNRKEMEDALGVKYTSDKQMEQGAEELRKRLSCENVLITLGAKGMLLCDKDGIGRVATQARNVADVSGAGDTVIATLTVSYASGATIREAAVIANYAAGLVCEEVGIVPIQSDALYKKIADDLFDPKPTEERI
ncbi:MAG TPA: D-glycero-beta-D-manno-heptose-7-phosphate kinase [Candidatus Kapabacteria bacterium]|nr:D-glycero-beta-D-manno-heptose-7-phosphate kinase [Candidatus Kapabacteria bacterium]